MPVIPERRVHASALMTQAMIKIDELRAENASLKQHAEDQQRAISQLQADLVTQRFVAQSHGHTVEALTRIKGDMINALLAIKAKTSDHDISSWMVRQAVGDMIDAALR